MDETLTRPTCEVVDAERPSLSIVIPAFNAADDLKRCLQRLVRHVSIACEIIVVDDASTDRTAEAAESFGVRCLRLGRRSGPAFARNQGAGLASGDWILFVDADVLVHPGAVEKAFGHIRQDGGIVALFGSYDAHPEASGLVSRFRNLLHHHMHQAGTFRNERREATTFWTGCGLIRRDIFLEYGGFDQAMFEKPAIEDIELGYRLVDTGHKIVLARDVLCTHLKPWSLRGMVRTDFFQRGLPWSLLLLRRSRKTADLNVDRRQKLAALAAGTSPAAIVAMAVMPACGVFLLACSMLTVVSINRSFLGLLRRTGGTRLVGAGVGLMYVYYFVCLASYATALALHTTGARAPDAENSEGQAGGGPGFGRRASGRPHFGAVRSRETLHKDRTRR